MDLSLRWLVALSPEFGTREGIPEALFVAKLTTVRIYLSKKQIALKNKVRAKLRLK